MLKLSRLVELVMGRMRDTGRAGRAPEGGSHTGCDRKAWYAGGSNERAAVGVGDLGGKARSGMASVAGTDTAAGTTGSGSIGSSPMFSFSVLSVSFSLFSSVSLALAPSTIFVFSLVSLLNDPCRLKPSIVRGVFGGGVGGTVYRLTLELTGPSSSCAEAVMMGGGIGREIMSTSLSRSSPIAANCQNSADENYTTLASRRMGEKKRMIVDDGRKHHRKGGCEGYEVIDMDYRANPGRYYPGAKGHECAMVIGK